MPLRRSRTLQRASLALVVAIASSTLVVPAASPRTPARATCKLAHTTTVAQNPFARVFTRRSTFTNGIDLVGCWKLTGRRRLLSTAFDGESSTADFGLVRLEGRFAAYYEEVSDYECRPQCPDDGRLTTRALFGVDLRGATKRRVGVPARPLRLLIDGRGAIAWPRALEGRSIELRAVASGAGERVVDSGAIPARSIALTPRGKLSWVNGGVARSALLSRAAA